MKVQPYVIRPSAFEPMPDRTEYAQFIPSDDAKAPFAMGAMRIPPGATTWRHNHRETELFFITAGNGIVEWEQGRTNVAAGDLVLVPPFCFHSFTNEASNAWLALLNLYWTETAGYVRAAAERQLAALRNDERSYLMLVDLGAQHESQGVRDLAALMVRYLKQQGSQVRIEGIIAPPTSDTGSGRKILERLASRGLLSTVATRHTERMLSLERYRHVLVSALDRVAVTGNIKSFLADTLSRPLPDVEASDVASFSDSDLDRAIRAIMLSESASGAHQVWLFSLDHAFSHAVLAILLLRLLDLPSPNVLHAAAHEDKSPQLDCLTSARLSKWGDWLTSLSCRVRRHYGGRAPDAGRWTSRHLGAFAALASITEQAARALAPATISLRSYAGALDDIVDLGRDLASSDPFMPATETFEAESRTTIAIEVAAARQLGVLIAPLSSALSEAIAASFGLGELSTVPWSRARELVPSGAVINNAPLDRLWHDNFAQPSVDR